MLRAIVGHPMRRLLCAIVVLLSHAACSAQTPVPPSSKPTVDAQASAATPEPTAEHSQQPDAYGSAYGIRPDYEACITHQAEGASTAGHRQECADQEFKFQDARLNRVYQEVMAKLEGGSTADNSESSRLRDAQREWLSQLDPTCARAAEEAGSAMGPAAQSTCYMDQTAKRADELERSYNVNPGGN